MSAHSLNYTAAQQPHVSRREKVEKPAVTVEALSVNVIGTQPLISLIVEGYQNTFIIRLDTVQQAYVARKITAKLPGSNRP